MRKIKFYNRQVKVTGTCPFRQDLSLVISMTAKWGSRTQRRRIEGCLPMQYQPHNAKGDPAPLQGQNPAVPAEGFPRARAKVAAGPHQGTTDPGLRHCGRVRPHLGVHAVLAACGMGGGLRDRRSALYSAGLALATVAGPDYGGDSGGRGGSFLDTDGRSDCSVGDGQTQVELSSTS